MIRNNQYDVDNGYVKIGWYQNRSFGMRVTACPRSRIRSDRTGPLRADTRTRAEC